jgi:hypothetical protein
MSEQLSQKLENHTTFFELYPNLYQLTHSTDIPNNLNFQIMF